MHFFFCANSKNSSRPTMQTSDRPRKSGGDQSFKLAGSIRPPARVWTAEGFGGSSGPSRRYDSGEHRWLAQRRCLAGERVAAADDAAAVNAATSSSETLIPQRYHLWIWLVFSDGFCSWKWYIYIYMQSIFILSISICIFIYRLVFWSTYIMVNKSCLLIFNNNWSPTLGKKFRVFFGVIMQLINFNSINAWAKKKKKIEEWVLVRQSIFDCYH